MELKFTTPQTELIYKDLQSRYNRATINKKELANEFNCSIATIDLYMQKGIGIPNYKKLGTAKNAKVVFNIIDVAEYLSQTIKTA